MRRAIRLQYKYTPSLSAPPRPTPIHQILCFFLGPMLSPGSMPVAPRAGVAPPPLLEGVLAASMGGGFANAASSNCPLVRMMFSIFCSCVCSLAACWCCCCLPSAPSRAPLPPAGVAPPAAAAAAAPCACGRGVGGLRGRQPQPLAM